MSELIDPQPEAPYLPPDVEPIIERMFIDDHFEDVRIYREEVSDDVARYTSVSESGRVLNVVGIPRRSNWTYEVLEEAHRIVQERRRRGTPA